MNLYTKINKLVASNNFLPDVMQGTDNQVIIKYIDGPNIDYSSDFKNLYLLIKDRLQNKEELYNYAEVKTTGENIDGKPCWYKVITVTANLLG